LWYSTGVNQCFAFILLGMTVAGLSVHAQAPAVTLKVDVVSETDRTTKGGTDRGRNSGMPEQTLQQNKSLQIALANIGRQELSDLTVTYYIFGKDVRSKDIVLAKKGEQTATLKSLAKVTINTDRTLLTSHSSSSKNVNGHMEVTPAGGIKFCGYGVQVAAGKRLLAATFDPPELKASTDLPETSTSATPAKPQKK
jgi:hypothetical protein